MNNIQLTKILDNFLPNPITLSTTVYTPILIASLAILGACSSSSVRQSPVSSSNVLKPEHQPINEPTIVLQTFKVSDENVGENNIQAKSYLEKVKNRSIQEQATLLLRATEFFFAANNPRDAIATLDKIETTRLSAQEHAQYKVLRAKSLGLSQRYSDSLNLLEQINQQDLFSKKYRAE